MFTNPLRSTALLALVLAGAALPSPARAQQGAVADPVPTSGAAAATTTAPLGSLVAPVDFVRWAPPGTLDEGPPQDRIRKGPNIAMMAVGGAAVVVGLVIGGDGGVIIATTGGVVGLIGLWRYLR